MLLDVPDGRGAGIFWWEPAVPKGPDGDGIRSRGMFDDEGNALPAISVFDQDAR